MRGSIAFLSNLFSPEKVREFGSISYNLIFFKSCKFSWSRLTIHSLRNRMNYLGELKRKSTSHLWEKSWNAWRIEILCAHRPKLSSVSIVPVYKKLRVFRCFYSIVINNPFEEKSRSRKDQTEQMSHLYTNQLTRNRDLIEHWACQLIEQLLVTWEELCVRFEAPCRDPVYSHGTSCALCILYLMHDAFLPQHFSQKVSKHKLLDMTHRKMSNKLDSLFSRESRKSKFPLNNFKILDLFPYTWS